MIYRFVSILTRYVKDETTMPHLLICHQWLRVDSECAQVFRQLIFIFFRFYDFNFFGQDSLLLSLHRLLSCAID